LGSGTFGEVWIGRLYGPEYDLSNSYAAIKVGIDQIGDSLLEKEFQVMKAIGTNTNIIRYIELGNKMDALNKGTLQGRTINYLALEFASNKNLIDYQSHIYNKQTDFYKRINHNKI
jgi:hypothetical protein